MKKLLLFGLLSTLAGCEEYVEPEVQTSQVIRNLSLSSNTLPADGATVAVVQVELPTNADATKRTVELHTTAGTFLDTDKKNTVTVTATQNETVTPYTLTAQGRLASPLVEGAAVVTARVAGYQQSIPIEFTTAYPDTLTITADKLAIKSGFDSEVKLVVQLARAKGTPSLNRPVTLSVQDAQGRIIGSLREQNNRSDSTGKCSFTYTLGNEKYAGDLTVTAATPLATGQATAMLKLTALP